jgi:hypothetical protein
VYHKWRQQWGLLERHSGALRMSVAGTCPTFLQFPLPSDGCRSFSFHSDMYISLRIEHGRPESVRAATEAVVAGEAGRLAASLTTELSGGRERIRDRVRARLQDMWDSFNGPGARSGMQLSYVACLSAAVQCP